jgi:hypothetical protein
MKIIQFIMMGLAILYLVFAGFTAVVGMFADGGTIWERALISGIHPAGAIALLVLVYTPRGTYNWTTWVAVALLLLSIAGDMAAYVAISMGTIKGDPWLALAFLVIPGLGVIYAATKGIGAGPTPSIGLAR